MIAHARARRPAAFNVDDPALVLVTPLDETHRRTAGPVGGANAVTDPGALVPADRDTVVPATRTAAKWRRRMPWATMFWIAAGGLVLLATALGITDLIEELARRAEWLGGIGLGLAIIGGIALAAIVLREAAGLYRLAEIDKLRERAVAILVSDDRTAGRALGRELIVVTRRMPRLARPRARLESHLGDIIDGGDLVRLAERELMAPLDEEARRLVSAAARRVSVVTAVSPRAAVDMFFVLITALGLVRRLALLYGGRPGTLALTGGMAASDSLIQQVIGHGLAAKLSARLGEGILNGLLTARLGLAAIEATRPLPFAALRQPALNDLAGALLRAPEISGTEEALPDQRSQ
jgi:putative membrane protein